MLRFFKNIYISYLKWYNNTTIILFLLFIFTISILYNELWFELFVKFEFRDISRVDW